MNTKLIKIFAVLSTVLLSTGSFAGEGCDMHDGIHKELSAEALKEFKENHIWLLDEDKANLDQSQQKGEVLESQKPVNSVNDNVVEI